jgi:hypothetical protein
LKEDDWTVGNQCRRNSRGFAGTGLRRHDHRARLANVRDDGLDVRIDRKRLGHGRMT